MGTGHAGPERERDDAPVCVFGAWEASFMQTIAFFVVWHRVERYEMNRYANALLLKFFDAVVSGRPFRQYWIQAEWVQMPGMAEKAGMECNGMRTMESGGAA
jgi:hypothetical protein